MIKKAIGSAKKSVIEILCLIEGKDYLMKN